MSAWWDARTAREKVLLLGAAALAAVIVYWQLLFTPLHQAAEDAQRRHAVAVADLRAVEAARAALDAAPAQAPRISSVRAELRSAADAGLVLSRMQPEANGAVTVWFEPAPAPVLFGWIAQLSRERGVSVSRIAVEQAGEGRVQAQATFVAGGS
jgi:type II secretory pathway component PulM